MCSMNYIISKHALNRVIERLVISQNIKLSKRQLNHYRKRAAKQINKDLSNMFAVSYSIDGMYKYIYTSLNNKHFCNKYVISRDRNCVVTVINNIDLNEEVKQYSVSLLKNGVDIKKIYNACTFDYIYTEVQNDLHMFVVDSRTQNICSSSIFKGDLLC